ncbi:T9SS type B sorting domain-containing protein [Sediminibacter sp. Hel_I_10]|uniref:T9SS type B sorting domain-containing protein n=1 Tax=Sediminibacter sp. Hel_I_10 TaxID=1392490 RepID=UPI00047A6A75|nr:T9SS type B sorting domain-containing protein [Sediminibacter sp. Hel_I_10]
MISHQRIRSKSLVFIILYFLCMAWSYGQEPNDCQNSVTVCGNSSFSLDVNGIGTQELNNSNTCQSQENNSIWLKINIAASGTLGFILTPASTNINEDYDFFVFGPNVSCGNIGQAIRCSTTNPAAANQGNNLTGLNATSTDPTNGPGADGDSFVSQLNVLAGESYFIVIDRPIGNSPFSLEWTGTASFPDNPSNPLITQPESTSLPDLNLCDNVAPFDDNSTQVDLTSLTQDIVNGESDVTVSYHASESDANINTNPLGTIFNTSSASQDVYIRIENTTTGCFILNDFSILVGALTNFNEPTLFEVCDDLSDGDANNGQSTFDFSTKTQEIISAIPDINYDISYFLSPADAQSNSGALPLNYTNTTPTPLEITVRIQDNDSGCIGYTAFEINVLDNPTANDLSIVQCDEDGIPEGYTTYDLNDVIADITDGEDNRSVRFYESFEDLQNNEDVIVDHIFENYMNPQTVFALVTNTATGCVNTAEITLETSSTASNDTFLQACDDDGTEDGLYTFNLEDAENVILSGLPTNLDIAYYETYDEALTEDNPIATNFTNTITYEQTVYARVENANACYGISRIELTVFQLPNIITQEEVFYCLNTFPETITLGSGFIDDIPNNYYYNWSTGEDTIEIEINEPGTYSVRVTSTDGCFKDRTITVSPSNTASFVDIDITDATSNNTISVIVSGEGSYQYALDNPQGPYQDSPVFDNAPFGLHTVYVKDIKNDCGIVEQDISVIGFPKYFTPNGDQFHPYWQVQGISEDFQPETEILIFDRTGKLLATLNPLGSGWDGNYKGNPMPTSDYWFKVNLQDGRTLNGHFTLKR